MKCLLSAAVEIISYWAWLVISVCEIEPKLKETTVSHFALRHYWWIEVYTCSEHGKSVKTIRQNRMGFSFIFSWSCHVCSCYKWCSFNGINKFTLHILRPSEKFLILLNWTHVCFFMIISTMKSFLIYLFH